MVAKSHMVLLDRLQTATIAKGGLLRLCGPLIALDGISSSEIPPYNFTTSAMVSSTSSLTRYREDDIGRPVVLLHIRHDIIARQCPQSLRRADAPPPHPVFLECRGIEFFRGDGVWIIELPLFSCRTTSISLFSSSHRRWNSTGRPPVSPMPFSNFPQELPCGKQCDRNRCTRSDTRPEPVSRGRCLRRAAWPSL